jgi:hypothetical protein
MFFYIFTIGWKHFWGHFLKGYGGEKNHSMLVQDSLPIDTTISKMLKFSNIFFFKINSPSSTIIIQYTICLAVVYKIEFQAECTVESYKPTRFCIVVRSGRKLWGSQCCCCWKKEKHGWDMELIYCEYRIYSMWYRCCPHNTYN